MHTKFITLDFWNTIATPNPIFAEKRNAFLAEYFDVSVEKIREVYNRIKAKADKAAIEEGAGQSVGSLYREMFTGVKPMPNYSPVPVIKLMDLKNEIDSLFLKNEPIINNKLFETIRNLFDKGYRFGVISNTNFISGTVLSQLIRNAPFSFEIYSDRSGYAKPNPNIFFDAIIQSKTRPSDITHIGDNKVCDYDGAQRMSINAVLIKNPTETLEYLQSI